MWSRTLCILSLFQFGHSWFLDPSSMVSGKGLPFNQHDFDLTNSVSAGAHIGIAECAHQFQYEKWNCPKESFYLHTTTTAAKVEEEQKQRSRKEVTDTPGPSNAVSRPNNNNNNNNNNHQKSRPSNRETAFIQAITSAGIAHTLTKNCSTGDFGGDCGCDSRLTKRQYGWKWGGCSDNFHFGSQVAREFLDAMEMGFEPESMANLHNNEAGRVAVRKKMRRICKCHGVSGSCTTQTCWSTLSDFRLVGSFLKKQYNQALRVHYDETNSHIDRTDNLIRSQLRDNRHNGSPTTSTVTSSSSSILRSSRSSRSEQLLLPSILAAASAANEATWLQTNSKEAHLKQPLEASKDISNKIKRRKLVFLQDSPDYCHGSQGVESVLLRTCVAEPDNPKSRATVKTCSRLCKKCGFKVVMKEVEVLSSCNCQFQWCCKVTCETCKTKRVEITCSL